MSLLRHAGPWHYQFIPGRTAGHQWRVADVDDDMVTDYATEAEAQQVVREHNKKWVAFVEAQGWKT